MVRKRIETVAEIRRIACCKLGMSVKSIHDEICVVYRDKQMSFSTVYVQLSFSTVYRWFTKFCSSQESVKDAPYSVKPSYPSLGLPNPTLRRSSPLLRKLCFSLSDSWQK